jgi:Domain of unknown function (DUF397)
VNTGDWQLSSFCDAGTCVETNAMTLDGTGYVLVRNSRVPNVVVAFDLDEWAAFLAGVCNGEYDHYLLEDG